MKTLEQNSYDLSLVYYNAEADQIFMCDVREASEDPEDPGRAFSIHQRFDQFTGQRDVYVDIFPWNPLEARTLIPMSVIFDDATIYLGLLEDL